jgi:hypothetical protein
MLDVVISGGVEVGYGIKLKIFLFGNAGFFVYFSVVAQRISCQVVP